MGVRQDDRPSYAAAVWEEFIKLRGPNGALNPTHREYYILSKWMDEGIPLPVILRAFGEFEGKPRTLNAMEQPVKRAYEYWFQAMGGL